MNLKRFWKISAISLLALALAGSTIIALANGIEGSEPDPPEPKRPPINSEVMGDDPDEEGYSGSVEPSTASGIVPSELDTGSTSKWNEFFQEPQADEDGFTGDRPSSGESISPPSESEGANTPNWETYMQGPQPDKNNDSGEVSPPGWSTFYYAFVAGTTLRPRDSSTTWEYQGGGCVSASSGTDLFNIDLDLPEGSRIDYLRIFFNDTSDSNSIAWITSYDGAGNFNDITSVQSSGNSGYGTELSGFIDVVVDNASNSYVLNWRSNQTGSSMALCGFRVAYRLP